MVKAIWKKFTSPAGAAILGLAGLVTGIYFALIYEKQGELVVRIDSLSRVLDVHQPVGGLEITYSGENLRTSKKTLWVLTVTVYNKGNAAVKKGDFDEAVPLGFLIEGAMPAEQPRLSSLTDYLNRNMKVIANGPLVSITPAVFEPGDAVQLEVLLLGAELERPQLLPSGKVAGQRAIEVVELREEIGDNPDFFDRLMPGRSLQMKISRGIVRVASIILIGVLGLAAFGFSLSGIAYVGERISRKRRQVEVDRVRPNHTITSLHERLLDVYVNDGPDVLSFLFQDAKLANEYIKKYLSQLKDFPDKEAKEQFLERFVPAYFQDRGFPFGDGFSEYFETSEAIEQFEVKIKEVSDMLNLYGKSSAIGKMFNNDSSN